MFLNSIGQRCVSIPEPELGLGIITSIEKNRLGIDFPATGEKRLYAADTPVLKRVQFHEGEAITTEDGNKLIIESIEEIDGLFIYTGQGKPVREEAVSSLISINLPQERLLKSQVDP